MLLWIAIALGVLQGLTEFLPVSSSGHLRLMSSMFGIDEPQTFFDVMLHAGSLVAVFVVYRRVFGRMIVALWRVVRAPARTRERFHEDADLRLFAYAIAAMVPTTIIALSLGDAFEGAARNIAVVGAALIVNGGILLALRALTIGRWGARRQTPRRGLDELRLSDALIVGTAQGFGIVRGISRSGSTITAGLLTGLTQEAAATFSFVLSVPAICGALVLKLSEASFTSDQIVMALVGAVASAVVGTLALLVLLRLLRRGHLHHFAWYCFAVGAVAIAWKLWA